jgi:hypothetical protein
LRTGPGRDLITDMHQQPSSRKSPSEIWAPVPTDRIISRALGIVLMLSGLFVLLTVAHTAWNLLEDQQLVQKLAAQVEEASRIDSFIDQEVTALQIPPAHSPAEAGNPSAASKPIRPSISYFAAWPLLFIILLIVGRVGLWLLREGGHIYTNSSYEEQTKKLLREMIAELKLK